LGPSTAASSGVPESPNEPWLRMEPIEGPPESSAQSRSPGGCLRRILDAVGVDGPWENVSYRPHMDQDRTCSSDFSVVKFLSGSPLDSGNCLCACGSDLPSVSGFLQACRGEVDRLCDFFGLYLLYGKTAEVLLPSLGSYTRMAQGCDLIYPRSGLSLAHPKKHQIDAVDADTQIHNMGSHAVSAHPGLRRNGTRVAVQAHS